MDFDPAIMLMPGNNSGLSGNQGWFYNNDMMEKFDYSLDTLDMSSSPSHGLTSNNPIIKKEIIFEPYVPTSAMTPPSSTSTPSPQMSLAKPSRTRSSSKKDKTTPKKTRVPKGGTASDDDLPEDKSLRRREQNRIAQRTFRERKDRYIQNLESHIKDLNAKHQSLEANYKKSTDHVSALYTQLVELQSELEAWRSFAHTTSAGPSTPSSSSMQSPVIPVASHDETEIMQALQIHPFYHPPPRSAFGPISS
ncbi:uncharacterized protein TRUGW13939_08950 [Talaromyces rugulosus]|uniref:BZIP domain-containing protein n=1 Tax=Talaromyces rugulosus TaxID=121627 RepID=A0A7H8R5Z3_TALRU|nr:uncharacterized protein TRUGW13939_08950 [Talaromyces rugulosus]QKX61794.1 hypothetical protein TRUGW13939_08950 [Talaromyces rugulosus]